MRWFEIWNKSVGVQEKKFGIFLDRAMPWKALNKFLEKYFQMNNSSSCKHVDEGFKKNNYDTMFSFSRSNDTEVKQLLITLSGHLKRGTITFVESTCFDAYIRIVGRKQTSNVNRAIKNFQNKSIPVFQPWVQLNAKSRSHRTSILHKLLQQQYINWSPKAPLKTRDFLKSSIF